MNHAYPFLVKVFRFAMVGLSGLVLDFAVTWLLKEKARANKYLANSCGFIVAVINNFTWNRLWTFESQQLWWPEMSKFVFFALIGLLLNNLLILLFHEKWGMKFYPAKALAIICVFVWNFGSNFFFNF